MMTHYRLGTFGFSYPDWRGPFYPKGLKQSGWLEHYAAQFNAVELNTTRYGLPTAERIEGWCRKVPETFRFAVKVGEQVTHEVPLRLATEPMRDFVDAMRPFGARLGPVLIQLPPYCLVEQFADFRAFIATLPPGPQYAVEFRSSGWLRDETYRVLAEYDVALVGVDHEEHPEQAQLRATADFLYIRLKGKHDRYVDTGREMVDPTEQLRAWLEWIRAVEAELGPRETWVTCSNDFAGHSPATLRRFAALAGVELPKPGRVGRQTTLFDAD